MTSFWEDFCCLIYSFCTNSSRNFAGFLNIVMFDLKFSTLILVEVLAEFLNVVKIIDLVFLI